MGIEWEEVGLKAKRRSVNKLRGERNFWKEGSVRDKKYQMFT